MDAQEHQRLMEAIGLLEEVTRDETVPSSDKLSDISELCLEFRTKYPDLVERVYNRFENARQITGYSDDENALRELLFAAAGLRDVLYLAG